MSYNNNNFWLICDNNGEECHCDWRATIVDCVERTPILYIYMANAIWSLIIIITGKLQKNKLSLFFFY
jgi:hypothetical protein